MFALKSAIYVHIVAFAFSFSLPFQVNNSTFYRIQQSQPKISKRSLAFYEKEVEICPSKQEWLSYTTGKNIENAEVQLVQDDKVGRQWFYTVKCNDEYEGKACRLIDSNRYRSKCVTQYNLVPAVVWGPNSMPDWTMIRIPSRCVCLEIQTVSLGIVSFR